QTHHFVDVLIASAGKVHHDDAVLTELELFSLGDSMRALESRNNAFQTAELAKGIESFIVTDRRVLHPSGVVQFCVLRSYRRIVETGRDRVRRHNLPIFILKNVGIGTVQYARFSA